MHVLHLDPRKFWYIPIWAAHLVAKPAKVGKWVPAPYGWGAPFLSVNNSSDSQRGDAQCINDLWKMAAVSFGERLLEGVEEQ